MPFYINIKRLFSINNLKMYFGFFLIVLIGFLIKSYLIDKKIISCNELDGFHFFLLEELEIERISSYRVCSGNIEGEITLTNEPSENVGNVIISSLVHGIKSTFEDSRAPYGGQITSVIGCDNKKYLKERVIVFDDKNTTLILAVTNDRQIFGVCLADQIRYVSAHWAGYDKSKGRVVRFKLFKPINDIRDIDKFHAEISMVFHKTIEIVNKI